MFDKEIIIDILKNKIVTTFFINNTLMDCCPGYYAEAGEGHGKHF